MISSTGYVDGSWDLNVSVPRFGDIKTLKVKGELHIGGLLLRLSQSFDKEQQEDWSDYALWWPDRKLWLLRTRSTLDQYGVQGSSKLEFTQMHKELNIIMPDLRALKLKVNFSSSVFRVVILLCKKLNIRYPEELSIARRLEEKELKKNQGVSAVRRATLASINQPSGAGRSSPFPNGSDYGGRSGSITPEGTIDRGLRLMAGTMTPFDMSASSAFPSMSISSLDADSHLDGDLSRNPEVSMKDALGSLLYRPKNFIEKARINAGWLDSSRSLMEQDIQENDCVLLRYKFFNFYDLNPKYDRVRINQIYQQARWTLMSGEQSCTEEEMLLFAALQVKVDQEMQKQEPKIEDEDEDEADRLDGGVDAALNCLQISLEGVSHARRPSDITKVPQLQDTLQYMRPKKMGMKSYKKGYFVLKDVSLSLFNDESEATREPKLKFNLKDCEVSRHANLSKDEFDIKLLSNEGTDSPQTIFIRLNSTEKYARWFTAFKLATQGRTMADASYDSEVESFQSILNLQRMQSTVKNKTSSNAQTQNFDPAVCIAPRFFKNISTQQAIKRISAIHSELTGMKLREAQLKYIQAWQMLSDYGMTYFIVKFQEGKNEELLAISTDHIARMDKQTGEPIKTWNYTTVENWRVNWDTKHVHLSINGRQYAFQCHTADCKVVHEFIGGYIFLSLRSGDKSQTLDEEYFQKLTGGRD